MSELITRAASFRDRVETREAKMGVVGLGYAGLPLALAFAQAGFETVGVDVAPDRVAAVQRGESYLVDVPERRYGEAEGRLSATTSYAEIDSLDAITICVPTPLSKTRTPDVAHVVAATEAIAEHLQRDQLVILQSTTFPGTTEEIVLPILERCGRRVGRDFFLGYAPERVDPGNKVWNLRNTPKLVAGITPECRERTELVFRSIVDRVVPVTSTTVAETAKVHENTFRAVNIALANELALMCDRLGISAWEVIEAAATKPFAFLPHYPGPGLGGDCIPVVPHFLTWRLREYGYSNRLIEAAHEVNAQMPVHVIQKVADALNESGRPIKGSRLLLLGAAYKADVGDIRESPSLEVMRQLIARGGRVRYSDPYVPEFRLGGRVHQSVPWTAGQVRDADCVVVLTAHRQFLDEPHWGEAAVIVDTRNVVPDRPTLWRI
jgi:UDP-N-acetyl-D-glucosamine dehydrogenase